MTRAGRAGLSAGTTEDMLPSGVALLTPATTVLGMSWYVLLAIILAVLFIAAMILAGGLGALIGRSSERVAERDAPERSRRR